MTQAELDAAWVVAVNKKEGFRYTLWLIKNSDPPFYTHANMFSNWFKSTPVPQITLR